MTIDTADGSRSYDAKAVRQLRVWRANYDTAETWQSTLVELADVELGDGWWLSTSDKRFQDRLVVLDRFVAREGHAVMPKRHVEDGIKIGLWTDTQKSYYKAGKLSVERQDALTARAGWVWRKHEQDFADGIDVLKAFIARENHSHVPTEHKEGEYLLGRWCSRQRKAFEMLSKADQSRPIAAYKVEALERVDGWEW